MNKQSPLIRKIKRQPEFELQKMVCSYLKAAHPSVLFMSDTIASLKLTKMQATRNAQIQKPGFKTPDVIVFEPRGKFTGLFIELKVESPYKLNGELKADKHIRDQSATIEDLKKRGYHASFQWEFDKIVKLIDWYLKETDHDFKRCIDPNKIIPGSPIGVKTGGL